MQLDLEQREGLQLTDKDRQWAMSRVLCSVLFGSLLVSSHTLLLMLLLSACPSPSVVWGEGWDLNPEKPGSIPLCDGIQYDHKESKCLHSEPAKKGALWVIQLGGSGSLAVSSSVSYQCGS